MRDHTPVVSAKTDPIPRDVAGDRHAHYERRFITGAKP
jgi:hypothetical protein